MPQLNPTPWFVILISSWLVFLTIILPKIIAYTLPNNPAPQASETLKTHPWVWQ